MGKKEKLLKKNKGFWNEFKKFALRGNVIDLAVGVIIGGAFQNIVKSVVNDLIMPFIGLVIGGTNFNDQFAVLKPGEDGNYIFATVADAKDAGATVFAYGTFITEVINFVIMAFIIFLLVKGINALTSLGKKEEAAAPAAPTTKKCPYCCTEIAIEATRCPHCTSVLEE